MISRLQHDGDFDDRIRERRERQQGYTPLTSLTPAEIAELLKNRPQLEQPPKRQRRRAGR